MRKSRMSIVLLAGCILGAATFSQAGWVSGVRGAVQYKFYIPDTSAAGQKYPLVLYLHPNGWQGTQYDGKLNNVDTDTLPSVLSRPDSQAHHRCFILAPEVPNNGYWVDFGGKGWGDVTYSIHSATPTNLENALSAMDSLIRKHGRIDTNRLHIAGGSMGGYATMYAICKYPTRFASATAMSFAGDTSRAKLLTKMPMWLYWGTADNICPVAGNTTMVMALRQAGADSSVVHNKAFNGFGHMWNQVWCYDQSSMYQRYLINWMFSQSRSNTQSVSQPEKQSSAPAIATVALHDRSILIRSSHPVTATALSPSGQIVATVSSVSDAALTLPSTSAGLVYVRVSDGARTMVRSVVIGH